MKTERYFELGLVYVRERVWSQAAICFSKAEGLLLEEKRSIPPALDSYYGLALAMGGADLKEAVRRCKRALEGAFYQPDYYHNLGRVYQKAKDKKSAVQAFLVGLELDRGHPGILKEMKRMGIRRRPVLRVLPRNHFLNKYLGRIRRSIKVLK